jgi:hypothetical protein
MGFGQDFRSVDEYRVDRAKYIHWRTRQILSRIDSGGCVMAATSMFGLGVWEVIIVALFGLGGTGLPLGIPPAPEDPLLAKVAPEDCTFYLSWSGMAKPDAASKNHTERLLAEAEVQKFVAAIEKAIATGLAKDAGTVEQNKIIAAEMPKVIKALLTKPTAVYIGEIALEGRQPNVDAGLMVSTGEDTAQLMASLARLESVVPELAEVEIDGQKFKQLQFDSGTAPATWGFKGRYFLLGFRETSVKKMIERARGETPQWLTAVRERNKVARLCSVTYVNTKKLAELPEKVGAPPQFQMVIKALGLSNVTHIASVTGLDDAGCLTRSHIAIDGSADGVFKLVAGKPLTAEDLAPIPHDATLAFAARFDASEAFKLIKTVVGSVDPRGPEELSKSLDELGREFDLDLSKGLIEAVGDTWRVYNAPSDGGLLFTGLTAVATVRDREALVKTSAKLEELAKKMAESRAKPNEFGRVPRHVTVKNFDHNGQKIYFVNFVGDDSPVSPAWCVTEKELIISLFPGHVKNYLNRNSDFKSVANVPEVAAALKSANPPTVIGYQDTREMVKLAYPVLQVLANVLCGEVQRSGADIDMSAFPSAGAILPHVQPSITTLSPTKDGIEITTKQTLPMAMGIWQAAPMMFFGVARVGAIHSHEAVPDTQFQDFDFDIDDGAGGIFLPPPLIIDMLR